MELPEGRWPVLYADPPWHYETYSGGRDSKRTADSYYETMRVDDLVSLRLGRHAENAAALFLWATPPCLPEALRVMEGWGFAYKTVAFAWVKTTKDGERPATGMGFYTRANVELVLLGTCGSMPVARHDISQIVLAPRGEHSAKPPEVARRIELLYPNRQYLELFARHPAPREGWTFWGLEA